MNTDYLKQNAIGFEGDTIARDKFKSIVTENKIHTIVETGTYRAATTLHFAEWAKQVHTVEVDKENFEYSKNILEGKENVKLHFGSSEKIMTSILGSMNLKSTKKNNVLFFLDAHWNAFNPLLDELKTIAIYGLKPIIAIHDFKVPGHPELGFDTYGKIIYEWDWIKSSIEKIYGIDGYITEYNSEATGAKRGIIYIYPKK